LGITYAAPIIYDLMARGNARHEIVENDDDRARLRNAIGPCRCPVRLGAARFRADD
jgi:hypothetical protein